MYRDAFPLSAGERKKNSTLQLIELSRGAVNLIGLNEHLMERKKKTNFQHRVLCFVKTVISVSVRAGVSPHMESEYKEGYTLSLFDESLENVAFL